MAKALQTNLLGEVVDVEHPRTGPVGRGIIRSVFLDRDGGPKYTVEIDGRLEDFWAHSLKVVGQKAE